MQELNSWSGVCKELVSKLYQLTLKLEPLEERGREYGYTSMSGSKYKEGFKDNLDLYEHTIEVANKLYTEEATPEEKIDEIIREVRTLVRNDLSAKITATFLNSCLRVAGLSTKFLFFVEEVEEIKFEDKYSEENNAIVANWMNGILDKVLAK
ncbi:MAG: hypothetical protein E7184_03430 [Erysipelotrichaceae bacterium]|nr:hypothetical protein [Erysipelotrichaceae bacterium]